ncbi:MULTISPECIES: aminodeoxychorismate synthase component 1 [Pantoea]|jgi:para-aminobenzoate synthetase component 1|uniref:Aminodeoxychorismate synthase component 1 n=1 Tax=Pantoea brenneri TaxID=472694 RepID=A0A7Y6NDN7_9GAMM|nr:MULTISPECIES: aminodeoxychorismate synthase component 1 [Pantoea]MBZ6395140.1 aminodeoxychorismate synthase component 1 [Pantoea sp.]MBZ6438231.1 aminodeoxychorismate synthase component 1 [Pantoea sp.]NUY41639.1 aminodeoxychorismate synthase component 1 [Pantoea brenneri]NUY49139.1 aminodeoxychorismate synthase component 1 [Pantoea brenneri]NUY59745.1 aminodeoxychorismate synthase component 1 [Pantoea brenneri]
MIVETLSLDYTPDALIQRFAPIASLPWAMLLSSANANHSDNRFDILTADPRATLVTRGDVTHITDASGCSESGADPLQLVQQQCDALGVTPLSHDHLPFQGGALGLFGYDLGRRFEQLPQQAQADLTTPDMAVGIYDWALIADHHRQTLTLLALQDVEARAAWLAQWPEREAVPFSLTSQWQSNLNYADYAARFAAVQAYIQAGDCYQVNLAQRFQAGYQGDEWQAICALIQANRAPFSAFLRLPHSAILSLSPERFLSLNDKQIETRPIKGTRPRCADPIADRQQADDLQNAEKDRAENLMIVDLLRNDIGRVAVPGSVSVPELFVVEPFPAVHHLVSTVRAQLPEDLQATDLLRACFPGGSITGAPKIRAMEIIDQLEPQRRNAWCGSIGYLSLCGRMDTSITIRTLIAEGQQLYCAAGGGIVADSEVQAEYQETLDKVSRILPALEQGV